MFKNTARIIAAIGSIITKPTTPQVIPLSDFATSTQERELFNDMVDLVKIDGLIAFHKDCPDATFAKYLMMKYCGFAEDTFMEYDHNTFSSLNIEAQFANKNILFLDVTPNPQELKDVKRVGKTVSIIDHHFSIHKKIVKEGLADDIRDLFYDGTSVALAVAKLLDIQDLYELQMAQAISDNDTFKEIYDSDCLVLAITSRLDKVTASKFAQLLKEVDLQTLYGEGKSQMEQIYADTLVLLEDRKKQGATTHTLNITGKDGVKPYRVVITDLSGIKEVNIFVKLAMEHFDAHYIMFVEPKLKEEKIIIKVRGDGKKYPTYDMNDICSSFGVNGGGHNGAGVMRIEIEQIKKIVHQVNINVLAKSFMTTRERKLYVAAKRIIESGSVDTQTVQDIITNIYLN